MKKLLLIFCCISIFIAKSQNGFTTYTTNLVLTGSFLKESALLVDNSGNKWIGFSTPLSTSNVGLVKYNGSIWTLYNTTSTPALPSNYITALAKDNAGNIWIGTRAGLVKFDGVNFTTYSTTNGLLSNTITCIEPVGTQIYVGTRSGLSRYDGVNFTNYTLANGKLPSDTISSIKAESSNVLWLGGYNRLVRFDINSSFTISSYTNNIITPSSGMVNCIYIDGANVKWIGTSTVGVLMYSGSSFVNAKNMYSIYGSSIPNAVFDISLGLNNGVAFKMVNGSNVSTGIIELSQNSTVYQYFSTIPTFTMGDYIENSGTNLAISQNGTTFTGTPKIYYSFNKTNYTTPLGSVNSNNFKTLDINNVKAGISNRSDMHWDMGGNQNAFYEVPKGSGKHSNYASALWIGGLDNANQLHGGAQTYRQSGVDFWPGPLDTISGTIDTVTSKNYDKIWKVSYTDINTFITAFNSGSVIATPDMLSWPAKGTGNNARNLAPFVDHNGDGMYNPINGDYPKIKGDQALYFIYNDKLATHQATGCNPMGIEVQGMAYAYGCPAIVNGKPELSYTTFYDYKITNRSATNYHNVFVSMWSDADLGYYGDDYIGSNVADNYGFAYNGDGFDEGIAGPPGYGNYIPAQGFNIVKGPIANAMDGIDNNNNGIVDELNEDCKLSKFTYFNNSFSGIPLQTTDPSSCIQYYNYMKGFWKDTTAFTCGGNAYGGSIPTSWVYSGDPNNAGVNTDLSNKCGYWTEATASITPGDRRMILSSGPFTLNAGQMQEVEYAFVTSFDSTSTTNSNLLSVAKLKTDIQKVNAFYNQVNKPSCLQALTAGITEVVKQNDFLLFPNPAKSLITISSSIIGNTKINYEVVDVLGKVILMNDNHNSNNFTININDLNSGIYFLRLQINNSVVVKKFVKE